MKAYLKILPYLGIIIGILALLLLLSFSNFNDCQIANSHVIAIKTYTQKALDADSFEMAKYHAYKALSSLEKTKTNLNECGCQPALVMAKDAELNLKRATRSKSLEDADGFLKLALQNTLITLDALKTFDEEYSSIYGDDVLVRNTKEVLSERGEILIAPAKQLQQKMDESLGQFETSLNAVVQHVDCEDAFGFINKIIEKSNSNLKRTTLTKAQRQYHTRVDRIARDALIQLQDCATN